MFHILTNVQNGESKSLLEPIDNRRNNLRVGLRSITYTVGWFNVGENQEFRYRVSNDIQIKQIPPGLYGITDLQELLHDFTNKTIVLDANRANGLVYLTVPEGVEILFTDQLLSRLGLDDGLNGEWLTSGEYLGDRPVNFTNVKNLYVHLEQINSSSNFVDGAPSNLPTTIGVSGYKFGDIQTFRVPSTEFKRLQNGTIDELKTTIKDINNNKINTSLPISVTLEIK